MAKERIAWIDCAKAIGICLVVLGHNYNLPLAAGAWIYSFHMPLFFILSGITFNCSKYNNFWSFAKKKAVTLLVPYFLFHLLFLLKDVAISFVTGENINFVSRFIGIVTTQRGSQDISIWFLMCLFISELVFYFIVKAVKGKSTLLLAFSVAIGFCGYLWARYAHIYLYWTLDIVPVAVMFVGIGYYISKFAKSKSNPLMLLMCIPGALLGVANYVISGARTDMDYGNYGEFLLMLMSAICTSLFVFEASKLIKTKLSAFLGKNSLFIYAFHPICWMYFIYDLPYKLLGKMGISSGNLYEYLHAFLMLAITIAVSAVLIPIYNVIIKKLNSLFLKNKN